MTVTDERPTQGAQSDEAALYDALADALTGGNVRASWQRIAEDHARSHFRKGQSLDESRITAAGEALLKSGAVRKRGPGYLELGPAPDGASRTPDSVPVPGPRARSRSNGSDNGANGANGAAAAPAKKAAAKATPTKKAAAKAAPAKASADVAPAFSDGSAPNGPAQSEQPGGDGAEQPSLDVATAATAPATEQVTERVGDDSGEQAARPARSRTAAKRTPAKKAAKRTAAKRTPAKRTAAKRTAAAQQEAAPTSPAPAEESRPETRPEDTPPQAAASGGAAGDGQPTGAQPGGAEQRGGAEHPGGDEQPGGQQDAAAPTEPAAADDASGAAEGGAPGSDADSDSDSGSGSDAGAAELEGGQARGPLAELLAKFHQALSAELTDLEGLAGRIDDQVDEFRRRLDALRHAGDGVPDASLRDWVSKLRPRMPKVLQAAGEDGGGQPGASAG